MRTVATIGVYGFDTSAYIAALHGAGVDLVLDVRQRRGVRGREYAWANAIRLQSALEGAGIAYRHVRELAPTTELRQLQYREDARAGVGKRSRTALAPAYVERYEGEILDRLDLARIFAPLQAALPALMCVELDPSACHRSLIAARLQGTLGWAVEHLVPGSAVTAWFAAQSFNGPCAV